MDQRANEQRGLAELLDACVAITRASGDIVRQRWNAPSQVRHKGSIDLVTDTDLAVEAFLKERLGALLPGSVFLAEESSDGGVVTGDAPCWIIDPVDGTTNFVHRIPQVATSVALWRSGEVVLGVVNAPMWLEAPGVAEAAGVADAVNVVNVVDDTAPGASGPCGLPGQCYWAARGLGAFCNGRRMRVSDADSLADALAATGFPYELEGRLPVVLERLGRVLPLTQGLRRMGAAALDLALVASGRLDVFYEAWLKPWDLAAGWLLVEEAGGRVSCLDGAPLRFGEPLLATNGRLHAAMVELLGDTA